MTLKHVRLLAWHSKFEKRIYILRVYILYCGILEDDGIFAWQKMRKKK